MLASPAIWLLFANPAASAFLLQAGWLGTVIPACGAGLGMACVSLLFRQRWARQPRRVLSATILTTLLGTMIGGAVTTALVWLGWQAGVVEFVSVEGAFPKASRLSDLYAIVAFGPVSQRGWALHAFCGWTLTLTALLTTPVAAPVLLAGAVIAARIERGAAGQADRSGEGASPVPMGAPLQHGPRRGASVLTLVAIPVVMCVTAVGMSHFGWPDWRSASVPDWFLPAAAGIGAFAAGVIGWRWWGPTLISDVLTVLFLTVLGGSLGGLALMVQAGIGFGIAAMIFGTLTPFFVMANSFAALAVWLVGAGVVLWLSWQARQLAPAQSGQPA